MDGVRNSEPYLPIWHWRLHEDHWHGWSTSSSSPLPSKGGAPHQEKKSRVIRFEKYLSPTNFNPIVQGQLRATTYTTPWLNLLNSTVSDSQDPSPLSQTQFNRISWLGQYEWVTEINFNNSLPRTEKLQGLVCDMCGDEGEGGIGKGVGCSFWTWTSCLVSASRAGLRQMLIAFSPCSQVWWAC